MWVENKVEKGIFIIEIKGGTERTGVQRFGTRYVEINAVKDNLNFFYWMPFSNIKILHLILCPIFPFKFSVITERLDLEQYEDRCPEIQAVNSSWFLC